MILLLERVFMNEKPLALLAFLQKIAVQAYSTNFQLL